MLETTKIDNRSFLFKTALSEANVEWQLQNELITKSGVLPVTTFFFFGKFVPVLEPLKRT